VKAGFSTRDPARLPNVRRGHQQTFIGCSREQALPRLDHRSQVGLDAVPQVGMFEMERMHDDIAEVEHLLRAGAQRDRDVPERVPRARHEADPRGRLASSATSSSSRLALDRP